MSLYGKAGLRRREAWTRLLLPLLLALVLFAPRHVAPEPAVAGLARIGIALLGNSADPTRFHRPAHGSIFILPDGASLRQTKSERKFDGAGQGPALPLPASLLPIVLRRVSYTGRFAQARRAAAPPLYRSRAPPFLDAA